MTLHKPIKIKKCVTLKPERNDRNEKDNDTFNNNIRNNKPNKL